MKILILALTLLFLTLNGCSSMDINHYATETPEFKMEEYFKGEVKAWGIIQNWRGKVIERFDIRMVGTWHDDQGTLEEDFQFYDGKKQHRTWKIKRQSDSSYEATADDIIGIAKAKRNGNAIQWNYQMDIKVDDSTYRISFDDWMWQLNDGVIINRSYMKKFGFTVGELTVFIQKTDNDH